MVTRTTKKATASTAQAQEQFAQLIALGASQAAAYRKATGTKATDKTVWENASKWAAKVQPRIDELRAAAKAQANANYVYEYEHAMQEADEALVIARQKDDPKAMISAVALKAKLSGLETDPRKNDRSPFAEMTEEELVEGINRDLSEAGYTIQ